MDSNEWKNVRLGDLCSVKGGKRLPKGKVLLSLKNTHPYIRVKDIKEEKYISLNDNFEYVDDETQQTISRYTVDKGDVIISIVGTIGLVSIIDKSLDGANLTENCVKLVDIKNVINEYLYYFLTSLQGQNEINKGVVGSTQPKLPIYNIQKIEIPLPPLDRQRNIVKILSYLDAKIKVNNKINENLQSMSQLLFKHWFVDFEFPNEEGFPYKSSGGEMIESELGIIPKRWKIKKVEDVIEVTLGGTPSRNKIEYWENGNIPWINSGKINEFRIIEPSEHITKNGLKKSATKLLPKRTTVIAITGATLGQVSLLEIDSCTNQSVVGLKESNILKAEFIYPWMKYTISKLVNLQTGGAQQHINKDNVNKTSIIMPEEKILKSYYNAIHPIFNKISEAAFENLYLKNLRDTLLPKLMNGEIDVSNIDINQ